MSEVKKTSGRSNPFIKCTIELNGYASELEGDISNPFEIEALQKSIHSENINKCVNIFCERNDNIQASGCRIPDCEPNVCLINMRFKTQNKIVEETKNENKSKLL